MSVKKAIYEYAKNGKEPHLVLYLPDSSIPISLVEWLISLGAKKEGEAWILSKQDAEKTLPSKPVNWNLHWKNEQIRMDQKVKNNLGKVQLESSETLKLFNPFHDRLGRFASKFGGGGAGGQATTEGGGGVSTASGSKLVDVTTKEGAIAKAKKGKMGTILKVGAGLLGIGVLGAVGMAVLSRKDDEEMVLGHGDNINDLIEKGLIDESALEEHGQKIEAVHEHPHELPSSEDAQAIAQVMGNFPKFDNLEDAQAHITSELDKLGIKTNPYIVNQLLGGSTTGDRVAGTYEPSFINNLELRPDIIERIKNGDPDAIQVLVHELGHSAQDAGGGALDELNMSYMTDENFLRQYIEGQNELVTRVAMAKMTGVSQVNGAYGSETATMAGVYKVLSQKTGQDLSQVLISTHSQGFVAPVQYDQVIMEVFPNRVQAPVFTPNGFIYPSFPSIQEMEQWLREDYGIESEAALQEILDQAVQQ